MIPFLPVSRREVLLEVLPHFVLVIRARGISPEKTRVEAALSLVKIFRANWKFFCRLSEFRKNNHVGVVWLLVDTLPVYGVIDSGSSLQSLLKAKVVVSVFQCIKTYIFIVLPERCRLGLLLDFFLFNVDISISYFNGSFGH